MPGDNAPNCTDQERRPRTMPRTKGEDKGLKARTRGVPTKAVEILRTSTPSPLGEPCPARTGTDAYGAMGVSMRTGSPARTSAHAGQPHGRHARGRHARGRHVSGRRHEV